MQLLKFSGKDGQIITAAAKALQAAKREKNKHEKAEKAAKALIARELKEKRQVDVELLTDKEIVIVQVDGVDTVKLDVKSSERFDTTAFSLAHPALHTEFQKPTPAVYFDSLLPQ